ncbi:MAG TPA: Ig-like domain-containing protein, partial [Actinomycetota bacterium]|nr:Ig-like domain-containing protein [Actinomycetota bacterium]
MANDGTNAMFRIRVLGDPSSTAGGFQSGQWQVALATKGVTGVTGCSVDGTETWCHALTIGIDGKSPSVDRVYLILPDGNRETNVYTTSGSSVPGTQVTATGAGDYFVDFQVPIADITAHMNGTQCGGTLCDGTTTKYGVITAATEVRAFYGTSAAANIAVINKDYMSGTSTSFTGLRTVKLSEAKLGLSKTSTSVSGPNPPKPGQTSVYDMTLKAANEGGNPMSNINISDTIPSGVRLISATTTTGGGTISSSPSSLPADGPATITWQPATIDIGGSATSTIRVSVTPTVTQRGTSITINPGAKGTWTDSSTARNFQTGTATACGTSCTSPAIDAASVVSVGPVANNAPVAAADTASTGINTPVSINVLANDTDAENDLLAITTATPTTTNGSTSCVVTRQTATTDSRTCTFTPALNFTGTGSFSYSINDDNGGTATGAVTVTVSADTTAPTVTVNASPVLIKSGGTSTITYSATEAGSYKILVGGTDCSSGTEVDSGSYTTAGANQTFLLAASSLVEGSNTIRVCVTDAAGNPGSNTTTVTKDTAAPDTSIVTGPSGKVASASASFTYSSTESNSTFECKLDSGSFTTCPAAGTSYSSLSQGSHTFSVQATDQAGNTDDSPASVTFVVDTVKPASSGSATTPTKASPITVTYSATDATAGLTTVALWVKAPDALTYSKVDTATITGDPTTKTGSLSFTPTGNGAYSYYTIATDAAGNVEDAPETPDGTVTYDTTKPVVTLTAPADSTTPISDQTPDFTGVAETTDGTVTIKVYAGSSIPTNG